MPTRDRHEGTGARQLAGNVGVTLLVLALAALFATPAAAWAQAPVPAFSKAFTPDTIGPGSISTLVFTIDNSAAVLPATGLAFTDTLPAAVVIATPANAADTCGGTLTAPDGGATIAFSGGSLGAGASCTVSVNVTSGTAGSHVNVSGDLTSSSGNSGTATDTLTVDSARPGFSKAFAPASVVLGSRSTLTFTIDNTAGTGNAFNLAFTDTLPSGIEVASPANASTTCTGGTVTAVGGSNSISYAGGVVAAMSSCTLSVDVIGLGLGVNVNVSGALSSFVGFTTVSSGAATAALTATADEVNLTKSFTDDPVPPGGNVTLQFTIQNRNRDDAATGLGFTDDLGATLTGLAVGGPLPSNPCGAGSSLAAGGGGTLLLTGGVLPAQGSCTFSVSLQVPAAATPGAYPNTTSSLSGTLGGTPFFSGSASDTLFVQPVPLFSKTFLDAGTMSPDPVVGAGADVVLRFDITNTSTTDPATSIAFLDELTTFLPFPVAATLPTSPCGGSIALVNLGSGQQGLSFTGGTLGAGASCSFDVTVTIPMDMPGGTYTNTTEAITASVNGETLAGLPASDSFDVVEAPALVKAFTDDPVAPGDTVTLQFTLTHDGETPPPDATGIAFTDDLGATLTGLTAVGLPAANVCGAGSQLSGTTTLSLTGGTLAGGASCTFGVTLQVPAGAVAGTYTNTTSSVMADVGGVPAMNSAAQDDLQISGLSLAKSFTDDPVIPGAAVMLEFTLTNSTLASNATNLQFTDNLSGVVSGLTSTSGTQNDVCGAGSSITGTSALIFTGGNLAPGTSCTFNVTLQVPAGAVSDTYGNVTSALTGDLGGTPVIIPAASDQLTVSADILVLDKSFTDDPVAPGGTATLEFTLTNQAGTAASAIAFTDDLDAVLPGLTAVGLPANGICGAGSQLSGTSVVTLTGADLAPGASCTFNFTVQVPADAPGGAFTNITSQVIGTVGGLPVTGGSASDDLDIAAVLFSKAFAGPSFAGGSPALTFTVQNLSATTSLSQLAFLDDLGAVLTGLTATGLPASDVCGAGSMISGTSVLTLQGGTLAPGGSCTIQVTLLVPAAATPGTYPNTTSDLSAGGIKMADPATASLQIEPAPLFAKSFAPATIDIGGGGSGLSFAGFSTLTLTIDNSASAAAATNLAFTDNLPAGVVIASPPSASTTCTGGTLTATTGSGVVSYSGGSVGAGASCTVQVDVSATAAGTFVNTTGNLTSSLGSSGTASATLDVVITVCTATLTPPSASFPAAGGAGSFLLETLPGCSWTVAASDPAVTLTGSISGSGDGTVTYDVGANPGGGTRAFTIDVSISFALPGMGGTHTITQAGTTCSISLGSTSASYPGAGGTGVVDVSASRGDCLWTVSSDAPWLVVDSVSSAGGGGAAAGKGNGGVGYSVLPSNWAVPRTATLTIGRKSFTVTQEAGVCAYSISPTSAGFGLFAGSALVTVDTGMGCPWTAVSNDDWVYIDAVDDGTGPGTVMVGVDRNESGAKRSGTATIAEQTLSLVQSTNDGGAFTLAPLAAGFPGAGGRGQITVGAPSSIDWDATPDVPWVTVDAPAAGLGSMQLGYTVAPNPTSVARSGQITVGTQSMTVVQAPASATSIQMWIGDDAATPPGEPTGASTTAGQGDGRPIGDAAGGLRIGAPGNRRLGSGAPRPPGRGGQR